MMDKPYFEVVLPTTDPDDESLVLSMERMGVERERLSNSYPPPFEEFFYRCKDSESLRILINDLWTEPEHYAALIEEVCS